MKGSAPILEYADFWPTEKQLGDGYAAYCRGQNLALVDLREIKREHERALESAKHEARLAAEAESRKRAMADIQADVIEREARKLFDEQFRHFHSERKKWENEKSKLTAEIEHLQRRVDKLYRIATGNGRLSPQIAIEAVLESEAW